MYVRPSCPYLSTMCTPLYTSIARQKSQFMMKTKLCCLSCRCLLMLCCNNIQTVDDWSWWHSWNIEEIDDDSIHPHSSIRIHHTVVFYYLSKGGDHTLCLYIFISIYWHLTFELVVERWRYSFFEKSDFFFLLRLYKSSITTTTHLWRLMLRSCQQNLLPSLYCCSCNKCMQQANINNVSHSLRLLLLLYALVVRLRIVSSYCAHIYKLRLRHATKKRSIPFYYSYDKC
jgi:hypothetical protein